MKLLKKSTILLLISIIGITLFSIRTNHFFENEKKNELSRKNEFLLLRASNLIKEEKVAKLSNDNLKTDEIKTKTFEILEIIKKMNIDVNYVLNKKIKEYENNVDFFFEEKHNNEIKIEITKKMLAEYNNFNHNNSRGYNSLENSNFLVFNPAVAAVLAYFSIKKYDLSYELLEHMYFNNVLNSIYKPKNGNKIKESNLFKDIINGNIKEGSSQFPKTGEIKDDDLYFSIKSFDYRISDSKRAFILTDRYDYNLPKKDDEYDILISSAVSTFALLQAQGVLTPFYTIIEVELENNIKEYPAINIQKLGNYDRAIFQTVTLAKGEYQDFNISFEKSGVKNIQTTGYNDSYLGLYDTYGNKLDYNDDGGYNLNAMISGYFYSNRIYIIRVKFYSSSTMGNIQLLITQSNNSSFTSISKIEKEGWWIFGKYKKRAFIHSNYVNLYRFLPENRKLYTIETSNYHKDPYLYLVDPRLPFFIAKNEYEKESDTNYFPNAKNDDSGDGLNSKFSIILAKNIPYLIIASSFNISNYDEFDININ